MSENETLSTFRIQPLAMLPFESGLGVCSLIRILAIFSAKIHAHKTSQFSREDCRE
jgi:hypothetical protein